MTRTIKQAFCWLGCSILCTLFIPISALAQSEPMLSYYTSYDLLPQDDSFSLDIYEDGMVLIHYPDYMKKAGDYTAQLSPAAMALLRLAVEHPLVQKFDPARVKTQKNAEDALTQELFAVSDHSYSVFEINTSSGVRKRIKWSNLSIDARRYPGIGILRRLADLEASIRQFDQHPTARRFQ